MFEFFISIFTQTLTFLPLAFGISISFNLLRATDMTIDGSFILGAGIFAKLIVLGVSPIIAAIIAILCGGIAGMMSALFQRGGHIEPLLAGILATFTLSSLNLILMGRPNINLITQTTLLSGAFEKSDLLGWLLTALISFGFCTVFFLILRSKTGLTLRAFGDNPQLLKRLGKNIERYRLLGFALTNTLAAGAGCLTAQTIGYADIGMGVGMTLTGIGAIILGQQILKKCIKKSFRIGFEFMACLLGVLFYFTMLNSLLRMDIDPLYLKMVLGLILAFFLRTAAKKSNRGAFA